MIIRKLFRFEAAHVLPFHQGKCARLHGHSYRLEVSVEGNLRSSGSETGMVMDFSELSEIVEASVVSKLDHQNLNDIVENPTCERVVEWIAEKLSPVLPQAIEIVLWETATACALVRIDRLQSASGSQP